jgi:predicted nucleic acid-binding protein
VIVYFDTSALVALYVDDACSPESLRAWNSADGVAASILTYAEALGTLGVLARTGHIDKAHRRRAESEFLAHWTKMQRVRLEDRLLGDVRKLLRDHPLKGADAVQLASAMYVARGCRRAGHDFAFACDDRTLRAAAEDEGIPLAW